MAIASGKGGTGKTLLATNIAAFTAERGERVVLADCDVEAPNDHLFFDCPTTEINTVDFFVAAVDADKCSACGACRDACAYGAVRVLGSSAVVFEELCHGCGLCADVCPQSAMSELPRRIGEVAIRADRSRPALTLVSGSLDVGQVKTPSVISVVRDTAGEIPADLVLLDAPPGVACAAVAAVRRADALLLVTEPTVFGHHDLRLGLELGRVLGIPMGVVVNRVGTGVARIDALCDRFGVPVVARIPFERGIAEAYSRGDLIVDALPGVRGSFAGIVSTMRSLAACEAVPHCRA